jgi:hypothetical protein
MQEVKSYGHDGEHFNNARIHFGGNNSGSVTLRFDNKMLNQLKKEARQKRISLNTLATQIFAAHTEYNSYASKAGMISFPKSLLVRLMDRLSEEEIGSLSEHIAKNEIKDTTLLMKGEYTLLSFIDMIEAWIRTIGFPYAHDISEDSEMHSFVIQHDMGRRWSIYFEKMFRFVFEDLKLGKRPYLEITDNSVVFKVRIEDKFNKKFEQENLKVH